VPDGPESSAPPRPYLRIDAHHHLWDVESGRYSWPTPAHESIYRTFSIADLQPELVRSAIDGTILVQTADSLDDTDSMLDVADGHPSVIGVVGWVPLWDARGAEAALDARQHRRLRGIRHLIHHEPDRDWLLRDDVHAGLEVLARRGLTFDVVAVFPDHLGHVPILADRHPGLIFVIDHLAKPPYRSAGWSRWLQELGDAAARPNVVAKLSGLDTAAGAGWTEAELRPAIDGAIAAFGPHRLMFGSDWPVCTLVSRYGDVVRAIERSIAGLSRDERASIMGGTAARVYGLT
jgi:L-fuconolactonase